MILKNIKRIGRKLFIKQKKIKGLTFKKKLNKSKKNRNKLLKKKFFSK